jgi:ABC-type phosphate transport system substrate-binding protein
VNKFISQAGLGIALSLAAMCAACGSGSSSAPTMSSSGSSGHGTVLMLCYTSPDTQSVTISSVFPIKTADPTTMIEEPWAKDFRRFLAQSGNEGGINVTCDQVASKDAEKQKVDELKKQGHTVKEVNYAYAN